MTGAWGIAALQQQLQTLLPGLQVEWQAEATSTNSRLGGRPRQQRSPWLLVAETQTAGRGRLDRVWQAQAGASLTFSLGLPLRPRSWHALSLAVGVALADVLDPLPPDSPQRPALGLKWPNDLWLWEGPGRGRKLGGVLIEIAGPQGQQYCVVGVGLNIAPFSPSSLPEPAAGAPQGGASPRACLQELHPGLTPAAALARVALALLQALLDFQAQGFAPQAAAYARRDLLQGQPVHSNGPPAAAGIAAGVDADGVLFLQDGPRLHRVLGSEVSVRFAGTPLPPGRPC